MCYTSHCNQFIGADNPNPDPDPHPNPDPHPVGDYAYRNQFIGADPVWNVTGGGGTNLKCLAANRGRP